MSYNFTRKTFPAYYDPNAAGFLSGMPYPASLPTPPPPGLANYTGCFTCVAIPPASGGSGSSSRESSGGLAEMSSTEDFALSLNISTALEYTPEEEGIKSSNEELLYDLLKTDTTLLLNDTLLYFYENEKEQHIGQLSEIKDLINNEEFVMAQSKLDVLSLSTEAEEYNKKVFDIVNKTQQKELFSFTEIEMNTLMEIGNLCPIKYGQAVYTARVLINTQYGYETMFWDDEQLCVSGVDYRKANPNQPTFIDSSDIDEFIIYPNPASTELNFKVQNNTYCTENTNFEIVILDVLGKRIYYKEFNKFVESGKINVALFANGVYLIKYACGGKELYKQSFILNR